MTNLLSLPLMQFIAIDYLFEIMSSMIWAVNWRYLHIIETRHSKASYCIRVPKTTRRFDDVLEGPREAVILTVMVCYSKRIKTKTSRGKGCLGWGLGETRCFPLPGVSSRGSHIAMHSTLPAMMWDMCEVLPTKEAWVSRVFIGDQPLTTQRPHDWPPRCRLQLLPSSIKGIFIINHTVRIDNSHVQTGRACFKAWGIQTSLLDRIFPRLTGYIPETT